MTIFRHMKDILTKSAPLPRTMAAHLVAVAEASHDVVERWREYVEDERQKPSRCLMAVNRLDEALLKLRNDYE